MPQLIPLAIYAVGTYFGVGAILVTAATFVATLAVSEYQKRRAERAQKSQYDASQVDRMANVPATTAPRELVLGRLRKGGNVFFRGSAGQFKQLFSMCITLAAHEIDGVEQVYFNDTPVTIDGSGNVTTYPYGKNQTVSVIEQVYSPTFTLAQLPVGASVNVVAYSNLSQEIGNAIEQPTWTLSGQNLTITNFDGSLNYQVAYQWVQFTTCATVRWYLGAAGQAADARLQGLFPGVWGPNNRADGIAYLIADFVYDETAMPNGLPNVTALIRGAKCYDPRSGVTQFTENPALMMRYVMMHPQFGKRISMSSTEDARIIAAANACDVVMNYGVGDPPVLTYRAAIDTPFGAPARDVLDDLAQAMGGQWAYASGELYMRAGVYQAPVMSLGDADLAVVQRENGGSVNQNQITISTHKARADKINTIAIRIWDQAAGFVETPITPFSASAYVAADGAVLTQEVSMPAVFYAPQAYAIAGIMLRDTRDPLTVTIPFKLTAYPVELLDGVYLTLARYGWVNKEFQVLGRTFQPEGIVQLTLKETSASIYAYGAGFVPGGYASNSTLPNPWVISPPTINSVASGQDQLIVNSDGTVSDAVRVTWSAVQDQAVAYGGTIEIQYLLPGETTWRSVTVPGGQTDAVLTAGIYDNAVIAIRARSRSNLAVSDWSPQVWTTVIGKTEPPPDILDLSIAGSVLSWSYPTPPPDLAGFIFRFHYGNNLDWNSATPLHTGLVTQSPFDLVTRPNGVVTIMGKAIDTTGNQSLATANIVMNLGDPAIANVVESWDFAALSWPYSAADSSGWTIISTFPTANALDSLYGTDDQSFYSGDTTSFYDSGSYAQMVYVTQQIAVNAALAGSIMTLTATAQGVDLLLEYRLAGPGSLYGPDAASFYGADTDPLYGPPGGWLPWPGQITAANDVYQFRVTIGAGATQGILQALLLVIDAPDIDESLANVAVSSGGTAIPYTKHFTSIKAIQATLQANGSGAVTVEIDKTVPLTPVIRAYNVSHVAVSGATVDISLEGY